MRTTIVFFFLLFNTQLFFGQSFVSNDTIQKAKVENIKFNTKQLIIPGVLFTYGVVALGSDYLKLINKEIREEVTENIDDHYTIDDFSQYAPAASVYVLNGIGIKGKNNFKDRTIVLATSYLFMSSIVTGLKSVAKVERPDGSSKNSFPSGHTATAFMGAEFLYQEYKDENIWYGISGYAVAAGTGFFRIYNGRHWLSDVVMGAGIGILSTKVAYWSLPYLQNRIFKSHKNMDTVIVPFYNGTEMGLGMVINLK